MSRRSMPAHDQTDVTGHRPLLLSVFGALFSLFSPERAVLSDVVGQNLMEFSSQRP